MSSEIVIVWQAEEPIRYRPQQTNLMSIRTKSSELSLFNPKKTTIYEIISLILQRQTPPLVSVRKMMIVKLPQKNNELEDKNTRKWY